MELTFLPNRGVKPRSNGVTMVMDKGLFDCEVEGLCRLAAPMIDFIKLGFGTSLFSGGIEHKIETYKKYGVDVYVGGTLFEAFYIRGQLAQYEQFVDGLGLHTVEVSDGSILMEHSQKCKIIEKMSRKYTVLSEVGSKVAGVNIANERWVEMMADELNAGSSFVIAEGREAGNVGIFDSTGATRVEMIEQIAQSVPLQRVIWEAPVKAQQVWFVKQFGENVNLGNIAATEIISLETIRCGMRGDTFALHLPNELKKQVQK